MPGRRSFLAVFDGDHLLVTNGDPVAQRWSWRTGALVASLPGHERWSYGATVAHPPGGEAVLVTGSRGTSSWNLQARDGMVRFWSEGA